MGLPVLCNVRNALERHLKRHVWLAPSLILSVALGTGGCGDDQDPEGAAALWSRIHEADYRSWPRAPGYEARRPSDAPHSDAVEIFINSVVAEALAGEAIASWPEGSLLVKDGYDDDGLDIVAAMEKRQGVWFWAEWNAEGDSIYSGDPDTCTGCHQSGADMVRAFSFPR
ncbi:hypothetical protein [Chondromyces crocatus]|uniref:Cytochrome P460 domain-containing protein n=1 Tax=Chondromyces crocatus TaxID=52 RepID=A0A0K1E5R1_CHOCO|nr:hypothetical protein [Chondromyces crocatus]AKT36027.1 uncharacterized protein CMC5_001390 [Chondromyces crocatus]